jgi:hypothetical protein
MIGETVERRSGLRHAWAACALLAAGLAAGDVAMEHHHLLIAAAAPAAVAVALLLTRRPPFAVRFEEDGLAVLAPEEAFVPYHRIQALCRDEEDLYRSRHSFPFVVVHAGGILNVPPGLSIPSIEVYRFLKRELPEDEGLGPPPALREYLRRHERAFGEDRVYGFRALPDPQPPRPWPGLAACGALVVVAIVWIAVGEESRKYEDWAPVGGLTLFIGMIGGLICLLAGNRRRQSSVAADGGLIITPTGFALEQGRLCGQMRWEEITDVEFRRTQRLIKVRFAGGELTIRDTFNRPLRRIFDYFLDYWEGPPEIGR